MTPSTTKPIQIRASRGWRFLDAGELWAYRDVLFVLALRDIKLRYKQTALGVVWVILQPLLAGLIFTVIFGHFAKLPSNGQPYLLYVFAGLLGWNLFAGVLQRAGGSLVTESRLITKVYFPRLLIPLSCAVSALFDFLVSLLLMLAMLVWFGVEPTRWLLLLPVVVLSCLVLATGASLWISALSVRYRDFMHALPFVIQIWFYASPVVYGLALIGPRWRPWFFINPMAGIIEGFRQVLLGTSSLSNVGLWTAVAVTFAVSIGGVLVFRRVEREFADNL